MLRVTWLETGWVKTKLGDYILWVCYSHVGVARGGSISWSLGLPREPSSLSLSLPPSVPPPLHAPSSFLLYFLFHLCPPILISSSLSFPVPATPRTQLSATLALLAQLCPTLKSPSHLFSD